MNVYFIVHSSFLVETDSCYLLFDYFEGALPRMDTQKPLYMFASHHHPDHFTTDIFSFAETHPGTKFILSDDIFTNRIPAEIQEWVTFVSPGGSYDVDSLRIETLKSTDLGVAFLVTCDGKTLYHAGDLNCWVWDGAPDAQNDAMKAQYLLEIGRLAGRDIFAAFVPLDPRQEMQFDLGMKGFIEIAGAQHIFPMHMWGDYSVVQQFQKKYPQYAGKLAGITAEGQSFNL